MEIYTVFEMTDLCVYLETLSSIFTNVCVYILTFVGSHFYELKYFAICFRNAKTSVSPSLTCIQITCWIFRDPSLCCLVHKTPGTLYIGRQEEEEQSQIV